MIRGKKNSVIKGKNPKINRLAKHKYYFNLKLKYRLKLFECNSIQVDSWLSLFSLQLPICT